MKREVKNPESVADHMFRMGLMALIAVDMPGVDRNKLGFIFIYFSLLASCILLKCVAGCVLSYFFFFFEFLGV